ncbi:MAG: hypothetical protein WBV78_14680 [Roseobacter sp.]
MATQAQAQTQQKTYFFFDLKAQDYPFLPVFQSHTTTVHTVSIHITTNLFWNSDNGLEAALRRCSSPGFMPIPKAAILKIRIIQRFHLSTAMCGHSKVGSGRQMNWAGTTAVRPTAGIA